MNDDGEVEALRSLVRLPWMTQQHFMGMLQARRKDQCDVYQVSFSNGTGSAFENSLDSGFPFACVPARCRKTTLLETWKWRRAETLGLLYGTTERSFNAVDKRSSTLTWTVCKAIGGSRQRGAANLYDVLIRGERWIVLMLSPIVRDVQRQRCWKRGSGDGQKLSLYDKSARLSDLSMPLKGEVRRSPEQSARQPIARSGKFVRRANSRRALGREKTTVLCFLLSWSTLLFERGLGEEGRLINLFVVPPRSETPKTSCQNHKQRLLRPRSGPSEAAHTRITRVKEQVLSKYRKKKSN